MQRLQPVESPRQPRRMQGEARQKLQSPLRRPRIRKLPTLSLPMPRERTSRYACI